MTDDVPGLFSYCRAWTILGAGHDPYCERPRSKKTMRNFESRSLPEPMNSKYDELESK